MSFMDSPKRIIADDYQEEDRELIDRLGQTLNFFMEQTTNTINGRLDFDNLNRQLIQISVIIDSNGSPITGGQFSTTQGIIGINTIRAVNTANSSIFPTTTPFVNFTSNGRTTYTIQNISGLQAGQPYTLTLELIF